MKGALVLGLVAATMLVSSPSSVSLRAQSCEDDEAIVKEYKQGLADLVATVKKETVDAFEKGFHQKACMTKLTLCANMIGEEINCLDKVLQDPATPKDQINDLKAKRDAYAKLKAALDQDKTALKGAEQAKDAKAVIEKFDLGG